MIKAAIIDFDGTLVSKDLLSLVCGIVGKEEESEKINEAFHQGLKPGISALIDRINLLKGVSYQQIKNKLDENQYLMKGAKELFDYLHEKKIVTILCSGNIVSVLKYYQEMFGIDYIIGSEPHLENELITGISESDYPKNNFKLTKIKQLLEQLSIDPQTVISIGDSIAEKSIIEFVRAGIAINPKGGIEKYADAVIYDDLSLAIPIIEKIDHE